MTNIIEYQSFTRDLDVYNHAVNLIIEKFDSQANTIGFATGSTMIPLYQLLKNGPIDFKKVVSFNLDEYVGLRMGHPGSFHTFMKEHIFQYKNFKKNYVPNGNASDLSGEMEMYEHLLEKHRIDFQILGVGVNGHIGFNEPGTSFSSNTHLVELTSSTRNENAKYFPGHSAPSHAITMGIKSILSAKQILLIAMGEKKRAPLEALLSGVIDESCPITALNLHSNVSVLTNLTL